MGVGSVGGVQRHVVRAGLVGAKGVLVCHAWRCLCLLQLCLLRLPHTLRVFLSVFLFFCCCAAPNVDCQQSTWSDWSVCSAACGGGTRSRHRETIAPASGTGAPCGALSETQACNELVCHNGTRRGQGVWMCVRLSVSCPWPVHTKCATQMGSHLGMTPHPSHLFRCVWQRYAAREGNQRQVGHDSLPTLHAAG